MKVLVLILVFHGRKYTDAPKGIVIDPIWMTFVTLNDFDELNINLNCDDHLNSLRNNNLPHPECPKKLTCFIIILTALISIILFSFNIFQDISKLQLSASPPPSHSFFMSSTHFSVKDPSMPFQTCPFSEISYPLESGQFFMWRWMMSPHLIFYSLCSSLKHPALSC